MTNTLKLPAKEKYEFKNTLLLQILNNKLSKPIESLLNSIRALLITFYEKYKTITINNAIVGKIQSDFVEERTKNKEISQDDLHRWICISKAVCCYSSKGN